MRRIDLTHFQGQSLPKLPGRSRDAISTCDPTCPILLNKAIELIKCGEQFCCVRTEPPATYERMGGKSFWHLPKRRWELRGSLKRRN